MAELMETGDIIPVSDQASLDALFRSKADRIPKLSHEIGDMITMIDRPDTSAGYSSLASFLRKEGQAGSAITQSVQTAADTARSASEVMSNLISLMFTVAVGVGGVTGYLASRITSPSPEKAKLLQKEYYNWKQEDSLERAKEEFGQQKYDALRQSGTKQRGMMWR